MQLMSERVEHGLDLVPKKRRHPHGSGASIYSQNATPTASTVSLGVDKSPSPDAARAGKSVDWSKWGGRVAATKSKLSDGTVCVTSPCNKTCISYHRMRSGSIQSTGRVPSTSNQGLSRRSSHRRGRQQGKIITASRRRCDRQLHHRTVGDSRLWLPERINDRSFRENDVDTRP